MEIMLEKYKKFVANNGAFNYGKLYDFDDMKLAIISSDFLADNGLISSVDYEDVFTLVAFVKNEWQTRFDNYELSFDEQGYIHQYAWRFYEKYQDDFIRFFAER